MGFEGMLCPGTPSLICVEPASLVSGMATRISYREGFGMRHQCIAVQQTRSSHTLPDLELRAVLVDATGLAIHLHPLVFQLS